MLLSHHHKQGIFQLMIGCYLARHSLPKQGFPKRGFMLVNEGQQGAFKQCHYINILRSSKHRPGSRDFLHKGPGFCEKPNSCCFQFDVGHDQVRKALAPSRFGKRCLRRGPEYVLVACGPLLTNSGTFSVPIRGKLLQPNCRYMELQWSPASLSLSPTTLTPKTKMQILEPQAAQETRAST